jgi:hypothetical protein
MRKPKFKPEIGPCEECGGSGQLVPDCDACSGNGWVDDPDDGGTMVCPECDDEKCPVCKGRLT